jgi:DNA-binding IclR family transcriptional regulator
MKRIASHESQTTVGVINLACPVLDTFGNVIAVLTCPYLRRIDNYPAPSQEEVLALLSAAAEEISLQVHGPPQERE